MIISFSLFIMGNSLHRNAFRIRGSSIKVNGIVKAQSHQSEFQTDYDFILSTPSFLKVAVFLYLR